MASMTDHITLCYRVIFLSKITNLLGFKTIAAYPPFLLPKPHMYDLKLRHDRPGRQLLSGCRSMCETPECSFRTENPELFQWSVILVLLMSQFSVKSCWWWNMDSFNESTKKTRSRQYGIQINNQRNHKVFSLNGPVWILPCWWNHHDQGQTIWRQCWQQSPSRLFQTPSWGGEYNFQTPSWAGQNIKKKKKQSINLRARNVILWKQFTKQ